MRRPSGAPRPALVAGRRREIVEVERVGGDLQAVAGPLPLVLPAVAIDLDAVAFRIVEIDRLADEMVGRAGERHALLRRVEQPAREIGARRQQKCGVIEAGGAVVVGLGARRVLELHDRHPAGAQRGARLAVLQHAETDGVAVVSGEPVEVAHLERDRADVQRRAAGEGRRGGGIGCVHGARPGRLVAGAIAISAFCAAGTMGCGPQPLVRRRPASCRRLERRAGLVRFFQQALLVAQDQQRHRHDDRDRHEAEHDGGG